MAETTNKEEEQVSTHECSCGAIIYNNELCNCKKTEDYKKQVKTNQDDTTGRAGTKQS